MVYHWSVNESEFPQVSRTLLSILTNLNNTVVWMVSTCPVTCKSFNLFTNSKVSIPSISITTDITVPFIFHRFILVFKQRLVTYLLFRFIFLLARPQGRQSPLFGWLSFFLLTISWPGDLPAIRRFISPSKSQRIVFVSFSWKNSRLCIHHLMLFYSLILFLFLVCFSP